jgi:hypothetical protein
MGRQARDRPPKGVIDRLKRLFEKGSGIIRRQKATKIQNFAVIILLYRYGLRPSLAFQTISNCGIAPGAAIAPPLLLLGLGLLPRLSPTAPAIAQSCQESMGQAVTGAPVQLDACSFNRVCGPGL